MAQVGAAASSSSAPPPIQCKIELPAIGGGDEQYGGTRTINSAYTFSVDKQIGEGTYGQVFMGNDKKGQQDKVALKKIRMDTEKEGFPITAIREIKILSTLQHENVVNLREIVRSELHKNNNYKGSIYMVFDYCEYDLTGLMETVKFKFSESQVKCIMKQLLKGLAYVHSNGVLHRDLKASNILIDRNGIVKLADFGLARTYQTKQDSRLTNRVITLWYRPPELLLGADKYGPEIDMWSVGCIFAELLVGKPLFPGNDETDQTDKIFKTMGTPTEQTWPGVSKLPHWDKVPQKKYSGNHLKRWLSDTAHKNQQAKNIRDESIVLLEKMLTLDPAKRITAVEAFQDAWFWKLDPLPCDPRALPCHGSSHEYTMKQRRNEQKERAQQAHPHAQQAPPQQQQQQPQQHYGGGGAPGGGGRMGPPQGQRGGPHGGPRGGPAHHQPPPYSEQPDPKRQRFVPASGGPAAGGPPLGGPMQGGRGGGYGQPPLPVAGYSGGGGRAPLGLPGGYGAPPPQRSGGGAPLYAPPGYAAPAASGPPGYGPQGGYGQGGYPVPGGPGAAGGGQPYGVQQGPPRPAAGAPPPYPGGGGGGGGHQGGAPWQQQKR